MDDYRYKSLQTLTRARLDAVQSWTREKQRFAQDKDIANTSATTLALIEAFETVDDLANCDLQALTAFVSAAGAGPEATAKAVQAAARGSYRLPKTVNDSINQAISVSIASMQALES